MQISDNGGVIPETIRCEQSSSTFFMMLLFFGCQEKLMKSNDNFLTSLNKLCSNNLEKKINILKYAGNGTIILWICILILLNKYYLK